MAAPASGLVALGEAQASPMRPGSVQVQVQVIERIARFRLRQTFINDGASAVEAAYVFPLVDGTSVAGFRVRFSEGREIVGEVRERQEAMVKFDAAVQHGLRAALLQQAGSDVFRTSIGSFRPGERAEVELEYCLELPLTDGVVRLTIPSHVAPRYCPGEGATAKEIACHEACMAFSSPSPGTAFRASVAVAMTNGVVAISSPSHDMEKLEGGDADEVRVGIETNGLQDDVVILIQPALYQPVVVREFCPARGTEALMLNVVPEIEGPPKRLEAVFVLDCSGSMGGPRIEQAKRATSIFLRSLPSDSVFNIVLFGSTFRAFRDGGSAPYDQTSLQQATEFVDGVKADMGGTNMFEPLQFVFQKRPVPGTHRTIFLLTDGQVSNQKQLFGLAQTSGGRVFAIGIGSGVSTSLLTGVGRASQGSAAFVQDHEQLEPVCISMLRKATSPSLSDVEVTWPRTATFRSQTKLPVLFSGDAFSCFTLVLGSPSEFDGSDPVIVTGRLPSGEKIAFSVRLPSSARVVDDKKDALLHHLFARSLIKDVEDAEGDSADSYKVEAIQLSVLYSVLCSYTAFIAVESGCAERCIETDSVGLGLAHLLLLGGGGQERLSTLAANARALSAPYPRSLRMKAATELKNIPHRSSIGGVISLARIPVKVATGVFSMVGKAMRCLADTIASASSRAQRSLSVGAEDEEQGQQTAPARPEVIGPVSAGTGLKPELMEELLRLAKFDGSFVHSPELQRLTGVEEHATLAWAKQWCTPFPAEVLVTARVLAYLQQQCSGQRAIWQLVARKARAWLQARNSQWAAEGTRTVDELIAAAP